MNPWEPAMFGGKRRNGKLVGISINQHRDPYLSSTSLRIGRLNILLATTRTAGENWPAVIYRSIEIKWVAKVKTE